MYRKEYTAFSVSIFVSHELIVKTVFSNYSEILSSTFDWILKWLRFNHNSTAGITILILIITQIEI